MKSNILRYSDTLRALGLLLCGLERFNKQFTGFNVRELERRLGDLSMVSLEFEIYYTGPELLKLELLGKVQEAKNEAIMTIIKFNQSSVNY